MKLSIEQTLQKGIRAHKEGNLSEAESFYRSIIKEYPQHPDANHNLGLILVSINKPQEAMSFFKIALDKNPKIEQFWFSYIEVLIREEHNKTASKIPRCLLEILKIIKYIFNNAILNNKGKKNLLYSL